MSDIWRVDGSTDWLIQKLTIYGLFEWLTDWLKDWNDCWLIYAHFSHKNDSSSISSKSLLSTSKRGWVERGVLFSLLFFRAHTLVLILMSVKKKELLSPPTMKKYYHANMKNSSLFLALVIVFTTSLPGLRRYRWQLCHILVKEWISWLSTFLSLMSCLT